MGTLLVKNSQQGKQGKIFAGVLAMLLFSSISYANNNPVCFDCHPDIVKDWRQSIHSENGITCHNCHGGNPKDADTAMDPKFGFVGSPTDEKIPDFCGKCHVAIRENYLKSKHSSALTKGSGPSCVTCHTAHKQKRASINLISKELCGQCHTFERAEKIKNAMLLSETEITNLENRISALRVQGYNIDPSKKNLFAVRNKFHRLTHVVDSDLILQETGSIQKEIEHTKADISGYETSELKRKIIGSLFIVFLFLGAIIFWWYRNTELSDQ